MCALTCVLDTHTAAPGREQGPRCERSGVQWVAARTGWASTGTGWGRGRSWNTDALWWAPLGASQLPGPTRLGSLRKRGLVSVNPHPHPVCFNPQTSPCHPALLPVPCPATEDSTHPVPSSGILFPSWALPSGLCPSPSCLVQPSGLPGPRPLPWTQSETGLLCGSQPRGCRLLSGRPAPWASLRW